MTEAEGQDRRPALRSDKQQGVSGDKHITLTTGSRTLHVLQMIAVRERLAYDTSEDAMPTEKERKLGLSGWRAHPGLLTHASMLHAHMHYVCLWVSGQGANSAVLTAPSTLSYGLG